MRQRQQNRNQDAGVTVKLSMIKVCKMFRSKVTSTVLYLLYDTSLNSLQKGVLSIYSTTRSSTLIEDFAPRLMAKVSTSIKILWASLAATRGRLVAVAVDTSLVLVSY